MYARITVLEWKMGQKHEGMEEMLQLLHDRIVPTARQQQGFKGFLGLSRGGEIILQSLWETAGDLQATQVHHFDDYAKDTLRSSLHLDTTPVWLQDYEVFTSELVLRQQSWFSRRLSEAESDIMKEPH